VSPVLNARNKDLRATSTAVKGALAAGPVVIRHAAHLHGLCAGLKAGQVTIEGDGGDYLGTLNDGAEIHVTGHAGQYLADNMTRGCVVADGNAGYGAGAYCYGGTVVVKGNAGSFTAVMNKGAVIVIGGSVGDEAATYMLAGDLVVGGNAGKNLGNYLIRGNIYIAGTWESLGHNTRPEEMEPEDLTKLRGYLEQYGLQGDPAKFKKIVRLSEKPFYKATEPARLKAPGQPECARS
jgi:glutamate synthase domain-containing protein 3